MALSTGQINDAYQAALKRMPTGQELQSATGRGELEGDPGKLSLIKELGGNTADFSTANPQNTQAFQDVINAYHDATLQAKSVLDAPDKTPEQITAEVKASLTPSTPRPQAPNLVQTFNSLRSDQGVQDLEKQLTDIKNQERELQVASLDQQGAEENKPGVPLNVISGRQTEEQRQASIKQAYITIQKNYVTDELSMRYSTINTIMDLTQKDYTNAAQSYEQEFNDNAKMYDLVNSQITQQRQEKRQAAQDILTDSENIFKLQQDIADTQRKNATANLQTIANLVVAGNMTYDKLSPDQKLNIQKLEMQSGLGAGFIENLRSDNPNGKVLYAGAQGVVMQEQDGTLKTIPLKGLGSSTTDYTLQKDKYQVDKQEAPRIAAQDANNGVTLKQLLQIYTGYMTPNQIYDVYNQNSRYGYAKEKPDELAKLGIKVNANQQQDFSVQ